jgi:hypothetical protein
MKTRLIRIIALAISFTAVAAHWGRDIVPLTAARVHASASLLLWLWVRSCGRLFAYV